MGGKAFTSGPSHLPTPRMPPSIYQSVCTRSLALLSTLYTHAAIPTPTPGKSSHGDIDILVASPLTPSDPPSTARLSALLSAAATISAASGTHLSFAIPYPDLAGTYIQLDLQICPEEDYAWTRFHAAHGDLWNIIGTAIRVFGLTATDKGLHVRIPEIEALQRKRSLLFLTREPARALAFLGLDEAWYARGFDSVEDMFAFCAGCRFMRRETYRRQGLKANDRKRMRQRPVYNRFVDEWLPDWQGVDDDGGASLMTREQALKEALETFGQKAEFESKVEEWRVERKEYEEKREGREARKARAVEEAEYADAWICAIK